MNLEMKAGEKPGTQGIRFLRFSLASEEYALKLLGVREVIGLPSLTPIPLSVPSLLGIMNLRGDVIPVFDLRIKLKKAAANLPEQAVIICDIGQRPTGLLVDSVNSVVLANEQDIAAVSTESGPQAEFLAGVYKHPAGLVLIIEAEHLLSASEKSAAALTAKSA